MATPAASGKVSSESRIETERESTGRSQIIVDLGEPQPPSRIRLLRKGKGKLFRHVERIVDDLAKAGTVSATAQPVVIVVRELPGLWPFDEMMDDD
jgi:uncharacterized protein DUF6200